MTALVRKNEFHMCSQIDEYMNILFMRCEKCFPPKQKQSKIQNDDIIIPSLQNYNDIFKHNYNIVQLKLIAKKYNLKMGGNKHELISRIFSFLYLSSYIVKIQKVFRGLLVKQYNHLRGPAVINRKLCTNSTDFITLDPIEEIPFHQFISYKDIDGFIYGFDITSLYNTMLKGDKDDKNPYNRNLIPNYIVKHIKKIIRLSKILRIHINLRIDNSVPNISDEKVIEFRTLSLFQNINALGNFANTQWFLSLNKDELIILIKELFDIWNFRAQLTVEAKYEICPFGNPFRHFQFDYVYQEQNMNNIRKNVLKVLENLVNTGVDKDSKILGAYYVLGGLTLVNPDAATSLPWLFQSVV
jgi:hypothetical protein